MIPKTLFLISFVFDLIRHYFILCSIISLLSPWFYAEIQESAVDICFIYWVPQFKKKVEGFMGTSIVEKKIGSFSLTKMLIILFFSYHPALFLNSRGCSLWPKNDHKACFSFYIRIVAGTLHQCLNRRIDLLKKKTSFFFQCFSLKKCEELCFLPICLERFKLSTPKSEVWCSIQLSYKHKLQQVLKKF